MGLEGLPRRSVSDRLAQFRSRVAALGLDAYWIVKAANVRYLSGFTGDDSTLLVSADRSVLITDSRFEEQAAAEAQVDELVSRSKPMAKTVGMLARRMCLATVGFTAADVTYADGHALASEARSTGVLPQTDGPAERMRLRKGLEEVEAIAQAVRIAEEAFRRFASALESGRSEKWLAGRMEWELVKAGAERAAFETICAVDERASLPHAVRSERPLGARSALLVDWGALSGGYNSDLTRVMGTGTMPARVRELSEVVIQAQEAALSRLGPGVQCCEVDHAARAVIAGAGYGRHFGHASGHGVGLEVHEGPRLAAGEKQILLPGMVVTVEPGIYLPGVGGVRIEDIAVITPTGREILRTLDKNPGADPQQT